MYSSQSFLFIKEAVYCLVAKRTTRMFLVLLFYHCLLYHFVKKGLNYMYMHVLYDVVVHHIWQQMLVQLNPTIMFVQGFDRSPWWEKYINVYSRCNLPKVVSIYWFSKPSHYWFGLNWTSILVIPIMFVEHIATQWNWKDDIRFQRCC